MTNEEIVPQGEDPSTKRDLRPAQETLDYDLSMRTAMYFGLDLSRQDAFYRTGVPWNQSDSWDELWDSLEREYMEQILSGYKELERDKYFVRRSLFRLRPPREPQTWLNGEWGASNFLVRDLQARVPSLRPIDIESAFDSFPEAFPGGVPEDKKHTGSPLGRNPQDFDTLLSTEFDMPIQDFMNHAQQHERNEEERILDILAARAEAMVDEYFEGLTLLRLTPSLEAQVLSQGIWQNEPSLISDLREGNIPETFGFDDAVNLFPEAF